MTLNQLSDRISTLCVENLRVENLCVENTPNSPAFNFELWAQQLRPQLLASLNKRK